MDVVWGWSIPWWAWPVASIAFMNIEDVKRHGLLFLCLGYGCGPALLLTLFGIARPLPLQLAVWALASAAALVFVRPRELRKLYQVKSQGHGTLLGRELLTLEPLPPGAAGQAEMVGRSFDVRNGGETHLPAGEPCFVVGVDGFVLVVDAAPRLHAAATER